MCDTSRAVERGLDTEDRRRQSAVSTALVAQATRIRPNVNAEDPFEPLYRSLSISDIENGIRSAWFQTLQEAHVDIR